MNITRTWRSWAALGSSIAITFAMSACGGTSGNEPNAEPQRTAQSRQDGGTAASGNVLVAYFSASGNTERVAQYIAEATGGDLFHLEPADPYTDEDLDWTDASSRVNAEHEDESLRDIELVSASVDNWDDYDVVFIGYPIWWGIAAWPRTWTSSISRLPTRRCRASPRLTRLPACSSIMMIRAPWTCSSRWWRTVMARRDR